MDLSVVMSVHDGRPFIDEAIASVLSQDGPRLEFIIIDDGSTDGSSGDLRRWRDREHRIRLVEQPRQGLTAALNRGIGLCQSPYVARMDADDVCLPGRFARQHKFLQENPEVVALGGQVILMDDSGWELGEWPRPLDHVSIDADHLKGWGGGIVHPTAVIRLKTLRAAGGYDERFQLAQDLDLWLRLAERGRLANLAEPVLKYRVHFQNATLSRREEQRRTMGQIIDEARSRRSLPPLTADEASALTRDTEHWRARSRDDIEADWFQLAIRYRRYPSAIKYWWRLLRRRAGDRSHAHRARALLRCLLTAPWVEWVRRPRARAR